MVLIGSSLLLAAFEVLSNSFDVWYWEMIGSLPCPLFSGFGLSVVAISDNFDLNFRCPNVVAACSSINPEVCFVVGPLEKGPYCCEKTYKTFSDNQGHFCKEACQCV